MTFRLLNRFILTSQYQKKKLRKKNFVNTLGDFGCRLQQFTYRIRKNISKPSFACYTFSCTVYVLFDINDL